MMNFFKRNRPISLRDLALKEMDLLEQKQTNEQRLREAEAETGDRFLHGEHVAKLTRRLVGLREGQRVITIAMAACRARRGEIIKAERHAEAVKIRESAERTREELARVEARRDEALNILSEVEGIRFTAHIIEAQPRGVFEVNIPASRRLRCEIENLEAQAKSLENAEISSSGTFRSDDAPLTRDEIITGCLCEKSVGITADDIRRWLDGAEATAAARDMALFSDLPMFVFIEWSDGKIGEKSHIFVRSLCRLVESSIIGVLAGKADHEWATFKPSPNVFARIASREVPRQIGEPQRPAPALIEGPEAA